MNIVYTKAFLKQFKLRIVPNKNLLKRYYERENIFLEDLNNPVLKNHSLKGEMKGFYSFSIAGDIRVIYKFMDNEKVLAIFIDIGSHNQVY